MKNKLLSICCTLALLLVSASGYAWVENVERLSHAQPQLCWEDIGVHHQPISTNPFTCPEGSVEYTPQTYTWSLAVVPPGQSQSGGEQVWFGTGGNVLCTTQGSLLNGDDPFGRSSSVCEFSEGYWKQQRPNLPDTWGDWFPPFFYQYDVDSRSQIDRTPYQDTNRNHCKGLRSAGYHNGVVFFAGGVFGGGITMFAFNAATGEYLGSQNFPQYRTIRKWTVVKNVLYTGVGTSYSGRILRWMGSVNNPFNFTEVGVVQGVVRELTGYVDSSGNDRLAVSAKGVFVSPAIPSNSTGLLPEQSDQWIQAWSPNEYEPDFTTRITYVGGGIAFLNGWLYFGTMHIPGKPAILHTTCVIPPYNLQLPQSVCFGEIAEDDPAASYKFHAIHQGTGRATSIWRIRNPESSNRETQLLYGEETLRAYNPNYPDPPAEGASEQEWQTWMDQVFPEVPNAGGYIPLLGSSGFNNTCNNYSWTMETAGDSLFVGTLDMCSMGSTSTTAGGDMWRFDSLIPDVIDPGNPDKYRAEAETTKAFKCGAGDICQPCIDKIYNYSPYGFRTLVKSTDGTKLYAGMATGVNLGAVGDGAGFQLLMLDSAGPMPTWYPDGDGDGYGTSEGSVQQPEAPEGYVGLSCDCDAANPAVNPGAIEICGNRIDDDCDGTVDEDCD